MNPDPTKTYLVSISGGKDSTAMWLYLKYDLKLPNIIPIFADTGWEHPLTYEYLDYLEGELGPLVRVKPELDFVALAKKKKRFPSTKARFCTENLKMKPAKAWMEARFASGELKREDCIQCSGVRHEESPARAKMADYVELDDYNKLPQWRPIITWTWQEVFAKHDEYGVKANPLYKQGMGRVGCMPCIMANMAELKEIGERFPEVVEKVAAAEVSRGDGQPSSFFASDTIPERFRSRTYLQKDAPIYEDVEVPGGLVDDDDGSLRFLDEDGEPATRRIQIGTQDILHKVATAHDVFAYVKLEKQEKKFGGELPRLFEEPPNEDVGVCSSIYGLCE